MVVWRMSAAARISGMPNADVGRRVMAAVCHRLAATGYNPEESGDWS